MRIVGNLLWWLFGGLEAAIGYFTGSLALACTIIGIPIALQTFNQKKMRTCEKRELGTPAEDCSMCIIRYNIFIFKAL